MTDELPSYEEALELLAEKARAGNAAAIIALERVLRAQAKAQEDEIGGAIGRILSNGKT
jgi:hypothetical protein